MTGISRLDSADRSFDPKMGTLLTGECNALRRSRRAGFRDGAVFGLHARPMSAKRVDVRSYCLPRPAFRCTAGGSIAIGLVKCTNMWRRTRSLRQIGSFRTAI